MDWQKLRPQDAWSLFRCGCAVTDAIRACTKVMAVTTAVYFLIQVSRQRDRPDPSPSSAEGLELRP